MYESLTLTQQTKRVQSRRSAKRNSIYKRLSYAREMIYSNSSHIRIKTLVSYIERTFLETQAFHEQFMILTPEENEQYDDMWIENIRIDIDICLGEVEEYMESRLIDPFSDGSSLHLDFCSNDGSDLIDFEAAACDITTPQMHDNVPDTREPFSPVPKDVSAHISNKVLFNQMMYLTLNFLQLFPMLTISIWIP